MKKLSIALLSTVFATFFATEALATSFDFRVGGSFSLLAYGDGIQYGHGDPLVGGGANFEIGLNFDFFGIYIDQDLAAIRDTGKTQNDMKAAGIDKPKFYGATYLMLKGLFNIRILTFEADAGIGIMYGKNDPSDCIIPRNNTSEDPAQLAFKFSLGMTFNLIPLIGIGVHVDYALGLYDPTDLDRDGAYEETHSFTPGLHVLFQI